jgi:DNA-binding NtrC family response regulator
MFHVLHDLSRNGPPLAVRLLHWQHLPLPSMLIVDPNLPAATALARIVEPDAGLRTGPEVALCSDFSTARARMRAAPPDLLITALRLREYNGLNLVYLAASAGLPTRSIVYTEANDAGMAKEIRAAGAFYEVRPRLPRVLLRYVQATLPPQDRREVSAYDRRRDGRAGGRRAVDQPFNF